MIAVSRKIEADVVIVGGGIGGAMAAIAAADGGAQRVVVLEKCHVKRSGSGATGNDHFSCYCPEVHGDDMEPVLRELMGSLIGQTKDVELMRLHLQESFGIVKMWEEWGINMRPLGRWNFQGHALPGRPRAFLKFDGRKQKAVLAEQMKKRGVTVLNHHPVVELAKENGRVCGALAIDASTPEPSFVLVKAPCVVLSTGLTHRLYVNASTPNYLFNTAHCPNDAGGQALGWRIGASMVNMEIPYTHAGIKYLQRAGKATWIGVYRYPDGRPVGPFITRPNVETGDMTSDVWSSAFTDLKLSGRGPAYMDCSGASKEDLEHMRWAMKCEGLTALLDYMDKEGIDPGRHAVEFGQYEANLVTNGIEIDINGESNVRGLFAAGDMMGNISGDIGAAAVYGWIAGHHAADYQTRALAAEATEQAEERMAFYSAIYERKVGASWQEANFALQQIMTEYADCGPHRVRSDSMLTAGIKYLGDLRKKIEKELYASDAHELMRAAEVINLLDLGQALMISARERKESRGRHIRSDYTFTNPLLRDKFLRVWKEGDEVKTAWRDRLI